MSNAVKRIKEMKKQHNQRKNGRTKEDRIKLLQKRIEEKNIQFNNPTEQEIINKIEEHKKNNTIYRTKNHDKAFRYIHDMKLTVDIVADYEKRGIDNKDAKKKDRDTVKEFNKTICLINIYMIVRETGECIYVDHAWISEELSYYAELYWLLDPEYGTTIYMSRFKAMKYAANYQKNGNYKCRYQIASHGKKKRIEYVRKQQALAGICMTDQQISEML